MIIKTEVITKMFQNRYITKGISSEILFYLQNLMWIMIDSMEIDKKGYLQIFKLEKDVVNGVIFQKIIHKQEQPEYEKTVTIPVIGKDIVNKKVFVIDDVSHCTMLLAEEYYSNSRMNGEKKKYFIQYFLTLSAFKKKNAYR